jgi:hypothetical protein
MSQVCVDHGKLIRRQPRECKRLRKALLTKRGEMYVLSVLHEHDSSCCMQEPWNVTLDRFIASLAEADPKYLLRTQRLRGVRVEPGSLGTGDRPPSNALRLRETGARASSVVEFF